jgi:protein-S-isoprenylcysteine O-methyltransferase Ste14
MVRRSSGSGRGARGGTGWFLAGYAGIAGFLGLEALARTPGSASSLNASREDQGTTRIIAITYGLAAELPLVLRRLPAPQLPPIAGPAGLMVQAAGLALRGWSMCTLGTSYSRTLRAGQEQHVVDTGPYRLVRHPGYTGSLLTWTGWALASRSTSFSPGSSRCWAGFHHRITAEQQQLQRDLPGYSPI